MALNCGMMLRECLRHEPLAQMVLLSEDFYSFFRYVEFSTFDIASDAFASFKVHCYIFFLFPESLYYHFLSDVLVCSVPSQDLLTRHKIMCADFLENNYDRVSFLVHLLIINYKNAHALPNRL